MVVREETDAIFTRKIEQKNIAELPDYDVLIAVSYSSLNYKDALSASGNKAVSRRYPHTPGIDAAGIVKESLSDKFKPGDEVIVTSYGLGTRIAGGFGQFIKVPAEWIIPLPAGLTLHESMVYGTAGFTAAQSIQKIIDHGVTPACGKVLVTGATGGVGSVSVAILAKLGFQVTAVTGKAKEQPLLEKLGATDILSREKATDTTGRMLLRERWAAVIDTVGGEILTTAIKTTRYGGIVTCCGNVASAELSTSVYPFILRGITLSGIDSAECPAKVRNKIWTKLASDWKIEQLAHLTTDIGLSQLNSTIDSILKGQTKGRVVVNLNESQ